MPEKVIPPVSLKSRALAAVIGGLALFLAIGVAMIDGATGPSCARVSISHYYYAPWAGQVYVMALTFVAAFLFAYRGAPGTRDGVIATIGGAGGLVLALFPVAGVGCGAVGAEIDLRPNLITEVKPAMADEDPLTQAFAFDLPATGIEVAGPWIGGLHALGATLLFAVLIYFSWVVFCRVEPRADLHDPAAPATGRNVRMGKRLRNLVYRLMTGVMLFGLAMVVAVPLGLSAWVDPISLALSEWTGAVPLVGGQGVARPIFHGEMLALTAFGISWLLKGRGGRPVLLLTAYGVAGAENPDD
ncbi:MAG: hypothetical protein ACU0CI_02425 [Shimia sp.]